MAASQRRCGTDPGHGSVSTCGELILGYLSAGPEKPKPPQLLQGFISSFQEHICFLGGATEQLQRRAQGALVRSRFQPWEVQSQTL